ncbi:calcium/proton exchanger [Bradyrhizobium sp. 83002]|uniref:calcium/proton exchanger n=1 Tax=Bradyrhizobium aeschynomenes TaxID=2734909 RepID=UPI001554B725|nr:calcium/proton exchanger [Bradyrhizobium aeschynomenes]NPU13156.1 calcium/proton exchanger [Bradyrhizobium aeschynomenes]
MGKLVSWPAALLLIVPIAPALHYLVGAPQLWIFFAAAAAIAVLADWVRRATEQVADQVGPAIGGLLNISFGSLAELILAIFVLTSGKADVVRAQITGSIIGTSLFGLGLAIVVGSIGREKQLFKRERAGQLSSLLILAVIALLLPAVFDYTGRSSTASGRLVVTDEQLSIGVSIVLIALYAANLVYTLITHRDVFASDEPRGSKASWSLLASLAVLVTTTAVIALEAHLVSGALEATSESSGLSPLFLGVIILSLVGTASDLFAASWFARQGKMGLVLNICVGSAIQIALVVAPSLVLISWLIGQPMTLVFSSPLDLFAIVGTAFIVNAIAADGETTWFEGVLLVGVYVLFGLAFFFV